MVAIWAGLGFILGAIVGSFLATAAIRWPAGREVTRGRSACDHCDRKLKPMDLIPIAGFLIRRGRCGSCGGAIDRRHLLIEVAAALIGGVALAVAPGPAGLAGALFGWMLLLLGVLDVEHFWLPDRVTGLLALTGIAFGAAGLPPYPNDRLIGLALGFAGLWLTGLLYKALRGREGLGGGDPKLLGAIGAWLGWAALPSVLVLAGLVGLGAVLVARLRGDAVSATTRLPLGALMAMAAWPVWLLLNGML
ncbi:prepilin peptidase [Sphingomonas sp. MAH-20]|jgi:leader peptidase (prepilin peptidase)/N-methyltransferase|uniref:Prepilin leader peptidase/N-methyltransferase n=1 Tax=Sphingomonas horti TaxID=2682842 RepID=A0A6I4IYY3_9SPHN|nr:MULTISPECIES: A24 family peptidase [Sphingomonas]MBA2918390.1 prepilin peptidase [Sphingomonas sp. CGMCC 1.13658]MVO77357.1 prepilin peptidase [Sphingomonas horti]